MPKDKTTSRPTKILSKPALSTSWKMSRDSKKSAGGPGMDGQSARSFGANLDQNLDSLTKSIKQDTYKFSSLRAKLIPKDGNKKYRLICIPTVRDRLVQRAISDYLSNHKRIPIRNDSSFGFVKDKGLKKAINRVIELREQYDFVFETDIVSFFDEIDRSLLISRLKNILKRHSLVPMLEAVIKCEVAPSSAEQRKNIEALGIKSGVGLRQGMPLSPLLANIALAKFDQAIERYQIPMVRYADDIVVFGKTRIEAQQFGVIIADELAKIGHLIPELADGHKTKIAAKHDPLLFLGREFYFSQREGAFIQRVSKNKVSAICADIEKQANIEHLISEKTSFSDLNRKLNHIATSYMSSYSDAHNATHLQNEINGAAKRALHRVYEDIFGPNSVSKITKRHREFLGIDRIETECSGADSYYDW